MGLADYVYRLKAELGDEAPHDELGISGDLAGSTIALVDLGNGEGVWQFSAGMSTVAIPPKTVGVSTAGGGITVALRMRVINYGTADYRTFAGVGKATPNELDGLHVARRAINELRAKSGGTIVGAQWTQGTADLTVVMCLRCQASGSLDVVDTYRTGALPERSAGANLSALTTAVAVVNTTDGAVIGVKDFVVWNEELSDADCIAIQADLRGALDGGGSTDATADGVTLTGTSSLTPGTAIGGSGSTDATAEGVTLTGTATLTPGTATGGASGSFVSSPMYSSGILQTSVALDWTWYPGAIGAAPTAALVHGSGATATDGTLTATGLSAGSGFLLAETADGAIYYEAGTVV